MRTSWKTDFRKLKITLATMTYHSQRPRCPSLSPHVLLILYSHCRCLFMGRFNYLIFLDRATQGLRAISANPNPTFKSNPNSNDIKLYPISRIYTFYLLISL